MLNTIMLIDDSEVDLLFTSVIIDRAGVASRGLQFDSARAALDYLHCGDAQGVEAILLDLNMPVMDGYEFLDAYQPLWAENPQRAIVVVLTSSPDQLDRARVLAYGCVKDYLVKPLDIKSALGLAARINHAARPAGPA
jgi:CheY-like chemotaxis protein